MTASLSIHKNMKTSWKSFPSIHLFFKALPKIFFVSTFFSYCQPSSVKFPFASFLSVPDEKVLGVYTRTFWFGSMQDLLSRWTNSGTASCSVWNSSVSSHVNAKPFNMVLLQLHLELLLCTRGPYLEKIRPCT